MMLYRFILCLALPLTFLGAATADPSENIRIATDRITDYMIEEGIPAASVAVAIDGNMIWSEGFGLADKESGRAADKDTAHAIGSVTKPFTAIAIMKLAEAGKIDLDAPINRYLGDVKLVSMLGGDANATVRHVLNHTSGLPTHYFFVFEDEPISRPGMDEAIRQFGRLTDVPGEYFEYSNFGYGLLETVIERVSGRTYIDYLQEEIFNPLGLDDSFIPTEAPERSQNAATRYRRNGTPVPFYDFDHRGAAAIFASAEDMATLGMTFLDALTSQSEFLSRQSAETMVSDPVEIPTWSWDYGLGWNVRKNDDNLEFGHDGGMPGTRARLFVSPAHNAVIAVAINTDSYAYSDIADLLTRIFVPQAQDRTPHMKLAEAMSGRWIGSIDLETDQKLRVALQIAADGNVSAQLGDRPLRLDMVTQGRNGYFQLLFHNGQIPTALAQRYPHRLSLKLRPRGDQLTGYAMTEDRPQHDRTNNGLSYWASFKRESPAASTQK